VSYCRVTLSPAELWTDWRCAHETSDETWDLNFWDSETLPLPTPCPRLLFTKVWRVVIMVNFTTELWSRQLRPIVWTHVTKISVSQSIHLNVCHQLTHSLNGVTQIITQTTFIVSDTDTLNLSTLTVFRGPYMCGHQLVRGADVLRQLTWVSSAQNSLTHTILNLSTLTVLTWLWEIERLVLTKRFWLVNDDVILTYGPIRIVIKHGAHEAQSNQMSKELPQFATRERNIRCLLLKCKLC